MITVNIRKQGGAAVMTIPSDVLKMLNIEVGSTLELEITNGAFIVRPAQPPTGRKRYTLAELLQDVTPETMNELNTETAWAREGEPMGREIL